MLGILTWIQELGWYPFKTSLKRVSDKYKNKWSIVAVKWFLPGFLNGCCIFISMWLLHIATNGYVSRMSRIEAALLPLLKNHSLIDDNSALDDQIASWFPKEKLSLSILDTVAAIFPAFFMLGVFIYDDVRLYTKIMFCNGCLALLKGLADSMTVLPDSAGWEACKARLTENGVAFMNHTHTPWDLLVHEVTGVNGHRLRWCSDMLISGHTYFTTLYALGLYELTRKFTRSKKPGNQGSDNDFSSLKWPLIIGIIFVACIEQLVEAYFVTVDRFHYTVDIFMAIIMTFTIYTNAVPSIIAKSWSRKWTSTEDQTTYEQNSSGADILLPICCFPFCCWMGRHHLFDDDHWQSIRGNLNADVKKAIEENQANDMELGEGLESEVKKGLSEVFSSKGSANEKELGNKGASGKATTSAVGVGGPRAGSGFKEPLLS